LLGFGDFRRELRGISRNRAHVFYSKVLIPLETVRTRLECVPGTDFTCAGASARNHLRDATVAMKFSITHFAITAEFIASRGDSDSLGGRREPTTSARARCGWSLTGSPPLIVARLVFRAIQRTL
jgi:hypothetical protein